MLQPSRRACVRKGCKNRLSGQQQVCDPCRAKDLLCEAPGCGKPHGGMARSTKLCPPCRAKSRSLPRGRKYAPWTDREDAIIRDAYARYHGREALAKVCALVPGRPRWSFTRRAAVLGAATVRTKEPRWTCEEDAILVESAWMSPERLVLHLKKKGFQRTITAVAIRMKRLRTREHIDGLTATGLAEILGVDAHGVTKWIERGWLKAARRADVGGARDKHYIPNEAIRAFLLEHPEQVELSKLERVGSKMWFLEMITGGKISEDGDAPAISGSTPTAAAAGSDLSSPERTVALYGERVTLTALSEISGRPVAELLRRIDGLGMGVESAAFGEIEDAVPLASSVGVAVGVELRAQMKRHGARAIDLAGWLGVPKPIVARMLAGTMPMVSAALVSAVEKLDGDLEIKIVPRSRSWEAAS